MGITEPGNREYFVSCGTDDGARLGVGNGAGGSCLGGQTLHSGAGGHTGHAVDLFVLP